MYYIGGWMAAGTCGRASMRMRCSRAAGGSQCCCNSDPAVEKQQEEGSHWILLHVATLLPILAPWPCPRLHGEQGRRAGTRGQHGGGYRQQWAVSRVAVARRAVVCAIAALALGQWWQMLAHYLHCMSARPTTLQGRLHQPSCPAERALAIPPPPRSLNRFYTVNATCTEGDVAEYGDLLKQVVSTFRAPRA